MSIAHLVALSVTIDLIENHFTISEPRQDLTGEWNFDPLSKDKGITNHVGMRNLGATCYLNSLLQQFFLIAPLRYGVFDCRPSSYVPVNSYDAQAKKEEKRQRGHQRVKICDLCVSRLQGGGLLLHVVVSRALRLLLPLYLHLILLQLTILSSPNRAE